MSFVWARVAITVTPLMSAQVSKIASALGSVGGLEAPVTISSVSGYRKGAVEDGAQFSFPVQSSLVNSMHNSVMKVVTANLPDGATPSVQVSSSPISRLWG